ncbi:MAG: Mannose-1-phosphate guanylyltransferase [Candidatus Woesebacteria bacterium GW2011_GWB1_38_5b]|uniref:Mannose-1-phosphate guanylyltransferase n=1 Tax=Candidatus Woesebacteria bacterium GW2011_GWB1_38_5b TaxID=1618569 RepID=A0A0G0KJF4_9BACT|nr:MAG: Mannose-1-phosphate guanylyltransferase [Candidatus Woesebacteria bacterium GW2011_GWB1_38_5b]
MKIIIFCGGYGTRMWPASRKSYPKQFYPLLGGRSFFQNTVARFKREFDVNDIMVSTEHQYVKFIHKQAPEILKKNIIAEPQRRDSFGAIALVTAVVEKMYPGEVMFFSWADHIIEKEGLFLRAVKAACDYAAETGRPVSVNQEPTYPSVHNGWLKLGKNGIKYNSLDLVEIERFIEKPNFTTAKKLFRSKGYLIHTGYGAWKSDVLLEYFKKYSQQNYPVIEKIMRDWGTGQQEATLKKYYPGFEKVSIEYGLFEKIPNHERLTIALEMGWKDAGTWELMYEAMAKKEDETIVEGGAEVELFQSERNLVFGPKNKMIALVGVSNLVVIDTQDGLLVCDLSKTKHVKDVFSSLESTKPKYVD